MEIKKNSQVENENQNSLNYLLLISPKYEGKNLKVGQPFMKDPYLSQIHSSKIWQIQGEQITKLLLIFYDIDDLLDFYGEQSNPFSYSQAILKSSQEEFAVVQPSEQQVSSLKDEISLEDFEQNQGKLRIKRKTSFDDQFEKYSEEDESTAHENSEKIFQEEEEEEVEQDNHKTVLMEIAQCAMLGGICYAAYQIFMHLNF